MVNEAAGFADAKRPAQPGPDCYSAGTLAAPKRPALYGQRSRSGKAPSTARPVVSAANDGAGSLAPAGHNEIAGSEEQAAPGVERVSSSSA